METFDYAAVDTSGKRQTGSVAAQTARDARDILRGRRLTPIDIKLARRQSGRDFNLGQIKLDRKISHKDLTLATRQLAILIEASTPIEEALKITALQFEKSPMRQVLLDTRTRVLEGAKLSVALRAHPKGFSALYTSMVASGETSGQLGSVMNRLAIDLEAAQKIRRKILAATVYPMVLTVVALLVVVILMVLVVPKVVAQFETFGQDLPTLTKAVIGLSNWLQAYGLIAGFIIILSLFGFSQSLKKESMRLKWHGFILRIPMIGRLVRDLNTARFARTISGLMASGTPSLFAMETARHTLRNDVMRDAVGTAGLRVREGMPMSKALKQSAIFPPLVIQMVAGGEAGGDVGSMFAKSADYLEGEFESTTTVFLSLLEPLIIIVLGIIVLLIIGAIFLPILRLNTLAF
ncbi:type II secretion system inner membrane protein GspF [Fretibacter rubidus]|uniref:type II secretion system inner membrane protein GspF n=1 Tax=Fretibacter rubidus TaxID=570162 RepID=UPI00352A9F55